jgi:hypothetical protein
MRAVGELRLGSGEIAYAIIINATNLLAGGVDYDTPTSSLRRDASGFADVSLRRRRLRQIRLVGGARTGLICGDEQVGNRRRRDARANPEWCFRFAVATGHECRICYAARA